MPTSSTSSSGTFRTAMVGGAGLLLLAAFLTAKPRLYGKGFVLRAGKSSEDGK